MSGNEVAALSIRDKDTGEWIRIPVLMAEGGDGSGQNGGYYIPAIDAEGYLTWNPSRSGMPTVQGSNIKGPKGDKGTQGSTGPQGPAGADGKTPVRGTDYWTTADIAQIKSYVDEAILGGAW